MRQRFGIAYTKVFLSLLSLAICLSAASGLSQQQHFSGTVREGEAYSHELGRGLVIVVTTSSIEIRSALETQEQANYAGCVTPPFHGPNALDLQAWQFISKSSEQFVGLRREFQFALNAADDQAECAELNRASYDDPTIGSKSTQAKTTDPFRPRPLGGGVVTLSNVQLIHAEHAQDVRIKSFSFVACIAFPRVGVEKHPC